VIDMKKIIRKETPPEPIYVPSAEEARRFVGKLKGTTYAVALDGTVMEMTHIYSQASCNGLALDDMRVGPCVTVYPTGKNELLRLVSVKDLWRLWHEGMGGLKASQVSKTEIAPYVNDAMGKLLKAINNAMEE